MRTEGEKRLSHSQPAADLKIQLHLLRMLRPWRRHSQTLRISRTHSGGDTARPCIYLYTWRRPQPDPHLHLDKYGRIQIVKEDTQGRQNILDSQTKEEIHPDTQIT